MTLIFSSPLWAIFRTLMNVFSCLAGSILPTILLAKVILLTYKQCVYMQVCVMIWYQNLEKIKCIFWRHKAVCCWLMKVLIVFLFKQLTSPLHNFLLVLYKWPLHLMIIFLFQHHLSGKDDTFIFSKSFFTIKYTLKCCLSIQVSCPFSDRAKIFFLFFLG